ncbi:MAG: nucleotidyltransferase substrate binding protein [Elusimicrobia bacterium]|nr:MAG: nucleotidyltransferase substrate binding protein [Elusimicrobiota bacterium]KAF0158135.1 MAG: nucleotidyltransferase substrate binding protein [Elusimicrobiota bacterium]
MDNPIRWKQRFENFERAYAQFVKIIDIPELSDIEKMALIQAFEFVFELFWKTMRDYLEEEGFELDSPKKVIRQAFQSQHVTNAEIWMEALLKRNNTVHNYNPKIMEETVAFIKEQFFPQVRDWYFAFKKEFKE